MTQRPRSAARRTMPFVTAAVIASMSAAALATAPVANAASAPIVIALEAPLTGSQASNGIDMYRGAQLAVDQVNAKGGVLGRKIKLIKADDQANPDLALSVAEQAKKAGAVAVIGPYNSSVGLKNLDYYMDNKIVPVQLTSSDKTTGDGITVQPKDSQISPVEIDWMSQSSGCPKVVMLVDPSAYTKEMADRVGKAMVCGDGKPVKSITVTEDDSDYTNEVDQALASNPDILYVSTYYPEGSQIAKAITAANPRAKCLMGMANVDPAFIKQAGVKAAKRCVFSGVPAAKQLPDASKYTKAYRAKFNAKPGAWGTFTYDSANVLFAAMERAGTTSYGKVLNKLLATTDFPGQTGSITIDPKTGNRDDVPVYIMRVNDAGTFVID